MTEYIAVNSNNLITSFVWSGLLDRAKCGELLEIIKMCSVEAVPIEVLQEIRQEIAEYGSICVEYVAKNRGDKDIELLIEDVLRQAKEQVLEIIDTHISALNNDQFERIWNHTVDEMKRRKIGE